MPAPVIAFDPVVPTSQLVNVAGSLSNQLLSPANATRKGWWVYNDSTANLFLAMATQPASTTSFSVKIASNGFFELPRPCWLGAINGVWDVAAGSARITEQG